MLIDKPVVTLPSAPVNRPWVGDRPGGGAVAVITESLRPVNEPEHAAAGRHTEIDGSRSDRPARDDAEMAARIRVDVARERAAESTGRPGGWGQRNGDRREDYIPAAEIRQLRERLEARLAREPGILTLHSIDVLT
ncbi:hypothetical protein [Thioalkalivibrio sp.]|uniref:hypothetical protein n=1 Tax=Thioalkalivibrio sp. TaxID=2093813 RepID=UPI0012D5C5C0|nr:hypothetical protein [Thioalkalivibrio sp.]TVP83026.1 MAG: hypothetical protein EA346_01290 [Thioalkalivibrio sp.]